MASQGWSQVVIRDGRGRVDRLCFGRPVQSSRRHRPGRVEETLLRFRPGQQFGLVRWRRDRFGSQRWVLLVAEAGGLDSGSAPTNAPPETAGNGAMTMASAIGVLTVRTCTRVPDIEPAVTASSIACSVCWRRCGTTA